jgi:ankyrin repeat protein
MPHLRNSLAALGLALALSAPVLSAPARAVEAASDHYRELYFDAAREGRADLLAGLIKSGMAVDVRDSQGYTALILAAYDNQPAAVDLLLERGADPCATDLKGNTALMGVAFKNELDIAERLVVRCDVNARNHQGQTAVMMAALFGHADIVRLLAQRGADLALTDASGNSAQGLARQQGNAGMEALLTELQARSRPAPDQSPAGGDDADPGDAGPLGARLQTGLHAQTARRQAEGPAAPQDASHQNVTPTVTRF